jgi:hypothetical protein
MLGGLERLKFGIGQNQDKNQQKCQRFKLPCRY